MAHHQHADSTLPPALSLSRSRLPLKMPKKLWLKKHKERRTCWTSISDRAAQGVFEVLAVPAVNEVCQKSRTNLVWTFSLGLLCLKTVNSCFPCVPFILWPWRLCGNNELKEISVLFQQRRMPTWEHQNTFLVPKIMGFTKVNYLLIY